MNKYQMELTNGEDINQYPYVNTISCKVEEKDEVDIIYQYALDCSLKKIYHCTKDICGKPTKFPNYGNFSDIFTMKTYGPEISITPWENNLDIQIHSFEKFDEYNCLDIFFAKAVYPIRVSIYEVYYPGNIIEIWALNSNDNWFLLWNGSHQIVPMTSRLFSPPLQTCNFKTKHLILKFKHNMWNNYTKIDAVMLIGSSELILPKNSEQSLTDLLRKINYMYPHHEDNLTADYENAHLDIDHLQENFTKYCIIYERDIRKIVDQSNLKNNEVSRRTIPNYEHRQRYSHLLFKNSKCTTLSANKSQELFHCSLSTFSDEILLKILKKLDLLALSRISQVDRRFNDLTRDLSLYTSLNLRYIYNINKHSISDIFCYFTSRCKYLKQLDFTFSHFSVRKFIRFLENCGKNLTHLRLINCSVINYLVLSKISTICKNLKVLDLTSYEYGFSCLENLENLEYLRLNEMDINIKHGKQLCKWLQKMPRIHNLNLRHSRVKNLTKIITELRNSCQNLKIIQLIGTNVTSRDIDVLSGYKNLEKISLYITDIITNDSLYKLFSSCQRLEEVYLIIHLSRLNNYDFKFLTCENLIRLYLCNIEMVSYDSSFISEYSTIFEQCPKLQEFGVNHSIDLKLIDQWKLKYPNVSITVFRR